MGCGDSRPKLTLDDFKLNDEDEAKVDRESVSVVWARMYPTYPLTDEELKQLVPSNPITEQNEDRFDAFAKAFLKRAATKRRLNILVKNPIPSRYLKQYFVELGKKQKSLPENILMTIAATRDPQFMSLKLFEGWYNDTGKPLLKKAFESLDADRSGVLDTEEASVFYSLLVDMYVDADTKQTIDEMQAMLVLNFGLEQVPFSERARMDKVQMDRQLGEARKSARAALQAYKVNKDEMNQKAFAVMDTDGDGTLQLEELLDIFKPNSPRNYAFYSALGFVGAKAAGAGQVDRNRLIGA